ncbi:MAG: DUF2914 domain-containing protein [Patescibacteria group bacterium]
MWKSHLETILAWLKRYERPLATALFVFGFIGDVLTFGLLDLSSVTILFAAYIAIVIITTVVAHATFDRQDRPFIRIIGALAPLAAQFVFGSLLSGFLIFFTKSAVLSISWPFIIVLLILFFGNEVFRQYRDSLIFQVFLVYFSIYAFALFALPIAIGKLTEVTFFESTIAALIAFALYIGLLAATGWARFKQYLVPIIVSSALITAIIVGSYFAGLLPPIPLTLKQGGIYHDITRTAGAYVVQGESVRAWWDPREQVVHHAPGTPLYAYSAISAPQAFSAGIMHVWQYQDHGKWSTRSTVAFVVSGGRKEGYRGYSIVDNPAAGNWRVLVQTIDGQTIGKFSFVVQNVSQEPVLTTQNL